MDRSLKALLEHEYRMIVSLLHNYPDIVRNTEEALEKIAESLCRNLPEKRQRGALQGEDRLGTLIAMIKEENPGCTVTEGRYDLPGFPGRVCTVALAHSNWKLYHTPGMRSPVLFHGKVEDLNIHGAGAIDTDMSSAETIRRIDELIPVMRPEVDRLVKEVKTYNMMRDINRATYEFQVEAYIAPLRERYDFTLKYKKNCFDLEYRRKASTYVWWSGGKVRINYDELDKLMPVVIANLFRQLEPKQK